METYLLYFLKVILCSYGFILVYHLFMRKDKNFAVSRIYIYLSLAASIVFPLLSIPEDVISASFVSNSIAMDEIIIFPDDGFINSNIDYLGIIYFSLCCIFLLKFIYRLGSIALLARQTSKTKKDGYIIYDMKKDLPSFSFLNMIFINKEKYSDAEYQIILQHEIVHCRQFHTLDNLAVEIIQIIFWFNPSLYLYRTALASIHEFMADSKTLSSGIDFSQYGTLILKESLKTQAIAFSTSFNSSIIKRRIAMMTSSKSSRFKFLKPIAGFVIILALVFAFNIMESNSKPKKQKKDTSEEFVKLDVAPTFENTDLAKNIVYPENGRKNDISCTILVHAYIDENGKVRETKAFLKKGGKEEKIKSNSKYQEFADAAVTAIQKTPFTPGKKDNKNVAAWVTIPVAFRLH